MSEKEWDGNYYKTFIKNNSHLNTKVNKDGRIVAIQFGNEFNNLDGPVELEKVNIDEINTSKTPKEINPYLQIILQDVVAPVVRHGLELGTDKLITYLSDKAIPSAKKVIKEYAKNKKVFLDGIKDGLAGKETKAERLLREAPNAKNITPVTLENTEKQSFKNDIQTPENIQQLIDMLRNSVLVTATCIRTLTNMMVSYEKTDSKKFEEAKKQLEELAQKQVMSQINLMLKEKNRELLDESSYHILLAFSKGSLIVDGKTIPITRYIGCSSK